jgi:hypothetical protein
VTRRPRSVRLAVRALAVGAAGLLTVLLAQVPVGAAFTAATGDEGNRVGTVANFCQQTVFLSPAAVAWTDQAAPATNQSDTSTLFVRSKAAANAWTWVRFELPPAKPGCILQAATLRLTNRVPAGTRTIDVSRGDPAGPVWTPETITWADQPAPADGLVGGSYATTPGQQTWGVTYEVEQQYAPGAVNNGFVFRDRTPDDPAGVAQQYDGALTGPTAPQLQLDWR